MAGIPGTVQLVETVLTQAATFEAGQPITVPIAPTTYEMTLPLLGKVKVTESGTSISITKG